MGFGKDFGCEIKGIAESFMGLSCIWLWNSMQYLKNGHAFMDGQMGRNKQTEEKPSF